MGCDNVGILLDFGHSLYGGESPAEAAQLAIVPRPALRHRRQRQLPRLGRRHGRRLGAPAGDLRVLPRPARRRAGRASGSSTSSRSARTPSQAARDGIETMRASTGRCTASTTRRCAPPRTRRTPCWRSGSPSRRSTRALAELTEETRDRTTQATRAVAHRGSRTAGGVPRGRERTGSAAARRRRCGRAGQSPPASAATSSRTIQRRRARPHRRRPLGHRHPGHGLLGVLRVDPAAPGRTRPGPVRAQQGPLRRRAVLDAGLVRLLPDAAQLATFAQPLSPLNGHPNRVKVPGRGDQHRPARARLPGRHRLRAGRQAHAAQTTAPSS